MSPENCQVLVVIPVYNHTASIRDVVERTLAVHPQVLVVDDGTTLGSVAAALAGVAGLRQLRFPRNRGKGAAIRAAARAAQDLGMTHLITLDADGQHDPADLRRFLAEIQAHPAALIVGTRNFATPHVPFASRFGRSFSNFWFRVQTGMIATDTQSGFRAYPLNLFDALTLRENGYAFEVEVLVNAAWSGVSIRELPVAVHYPPPAERISHFHARRDNVRISMLNTRLTMRSMLPWPHRQLGPGAAGRPKITLLHPWRSLRVLLSETGSPLQLALAGALGVLLGTLPLIGCQMMVILIAAGYLGLNRAGAVMASQLCLPPLVPALCIEVGYFIRHGDWLRELSLRTLGYQGLERLWEWVLGAVVVGPVLAVAIGGVVYGMALCLKAGLRATE
ncbi:MAG: DUF2062 domain-containing protein [bacterium]